MTTTEQKDPINIRAQSIFRTDPEAEGHAGCIAVRFSCFVDTDEPVTTVSTEGGSDATQRRIKSHFPKMRNLFGEVVYGQIAEAVAGLEKAFGDDDYSEVESKLRELKELVRSHVEGGLTDGRSAERPDH